eukprot:14520868-Alexandrium_andersonii.AAC.1
MLASTRPVKAQPRRRTQTTLVNGRRPPNIVEEPGHPLMKRPTTSPKGATGARGTRPAGGMAPGHPRAQLV